MEHTAAFFVMSFVALVANTVTLIYIFRFVQQRLLTQSYKQNSCVAVDSTLELTCFFILSWKFFLETGPGPDPIDKIPA